VRRGKLIRSDDRGATWQLQSVGVTAAVTLRAVHALPGGGVVVVGSADTIVRQSARGGGWQHQPTPGGGVELCAVAFLDAAVGFVAVRPPPSTRMSSSGITPINTRQRPPCSGSQHRWRAAEGMDSPTPTDTSRSNLAAVLALLSSWRFFVLINLLRRGWCTETAMKKLRIVKLGFGTSCKRMAIE
jgi:hypothetical protein